MNMGATVFGVCDRRHPTEESLGSNVTLLKMLPLYDRCIGTYTMKIHTQLRIKAWTSLMHPMNTAKSDGQT